MGTKIKSLPKRLADKHRVYQLNVDSRQQNESPIFIEGDNISIDISNKPYVIISSTLQGVTSGLTSYIEVTSNYTLTSNDYTVNCTSGSFTVTLPTAVGIAGRCFEVTNTGSGEITLDTTSSETIQGDSKQTVYQDECFVVRSTGANWIVI